MPVNEFSIFIQTFFNRQDISCLSRLFPAQQNFTPNAHSSSACVCVCVFLHSENLPFAKLTKSNLSDLNHVRKVFKEKCQVPLFFFFYCKRDCYLAIRGCWLICSVDLVSVVLSFVMCPQYKMMSE